MAFKKGCIVYSQQVQTTRTHKRTTIQTLTRTARRAQYTAPVVIQVVVALAAVVRLAIEKIVSAWMEYERNGLL